MPQSASGGWVKQNYAAGIPSTQIAGAVSRPLSALAFGCFQRVNFCFGFIGFNGQMGRQVAIAVSPLNGRFRAGGAIPSGRKFGAAVAAIALLDDLVTNSTIIRASF